MANFSELLDQGKEWLSNIDWSKYKNDPALQQMAGVGLGGTVGLLALLLSKRGNKIRNALMLGLPAYALGAFGPKMWDYGKNAYNEAKRGYRNFKEQKNYEQGKGYRRYAEELKRVRNLPEDTWISKGVNRLRGVPGKTELLNRLNEMDPDQFDVLRYNPIQGRLEDKPIDWKNHSAITGNVK